MSRLFADRVFHVAYKIVHTYGSLRKVYDLTLAATVFTSNMAAV